MAGQPRWHVIREGEIGLYHTWSRCVQRAFLCGEDEYSKRDYSYRREWIEKLLEYQAGVFAIDVANYSVLSNHMHHILRNRPDIVKTWSDEEVACRWKMAWPEWNGKDWTREPTDEEVRELLANPEKMALARRGLGSVSWFQARCKEPIAKLANSEMETRGHFWEQRFGAREIADESALLTCMVYVDVNQVKAGLAPSLEASKCSAMAVRMAAQRLEAEASHKKFHKKRRGEFELSMEQIEALLADSWLAPIEANGLLITEGHVAPEKISVPSSPKNSEPASASDAETPSEKAQAPNEDVETPEPSDCSKPATTESPQRAHAAGIPASTPLEELNYSIYFRYFGPSARGRRRRASDNPILAMPFTQYREMVEWVAEQMGVEVERPGPLPEWLVKYLRSRGADTEHWLTAVQNFEAWFGHVVGSVERLRERLERTGNRWIRGMRNCRATFG